MFYVCIVTAPSDSLFNLCGVLAKLLSLIAGGEIIPADSREGPCGGVQGRSAKQGARQGSCVHLPSLRKDSPQHQCLSIRPFPAPLAHVHPEYFPGQGRSTLKLQPIAGKLHCHEIDY